MVKTTLGASVKFLGNYQRCFCANWRKLASFNDEFDGVHRLFKRHIWKKNLHRNIPSTASVRLVISTRFATAPGRLKNNASPLFCICCLHKTTWGRLRLSEITMMRPAAKVSFCAPFARRILSALTAFHKIYDSRLPTHEMRALPLSLSFACRSYFVNYRHCYVKNSSRTSLCKRLPRCLHLYKFLSSRRRRIKTASR